MTEILCDQRSPGQWLLVPLVVGSDRIPISGDMGMFSSRRRGIKASDSVGFWLVDVIGLNWSVGLLDKAVRKTTVSLHDSYHE